MRDRSEFKELTQYFPLETLILFEVVILALWAVIWYLAGRRDRRRNMR